MKVENVIEICEKLRLKTISQRLMDFSDKISDWEEKHEQYLRYLYNLLEFEHKHRQEIRILRLIREAKFSIIKGLESFDFNQVPQLPEQKIRDLAKGVYISKDHSGGIPEDHS